MERIINTEQEMEQLAAAIAKYAAAGDVIRLQGNLGAGKSVFARAFIRALGSKAAHLASPTYTLYQTYDDCRLPVIHADLYRIDDPAELENLDFTPWLKHGITLVEWPEKGGDWFLEERPDQLDFHIMEMDNGGTLTMAIAEIPQGRSVMLRASNSWKRRLGLIDKSCARPSTEEGRQKFLKNLGYRGYLTLPVSADWSFRTYWRVQTPEGSRVIMDAPPPMEDVRPFIKMATYLERIGLHAPRIYAKDEQNGYLLLEDLGDTTMGKAVFEQGLNMQAWYEKAVDVLVHLAKAEPAPIRRYTMDALWGEAARFCDWYLPYQHNHALHTADRRIFRELLNPLFETILSAPTTTVLWDYHADNLMVQKQHPGDGLHDLAVIDFQDARIGPISYDMSMLLQDARYILPEELEKQLIKRFVDGLDGLVTMEQFMETYTLINLQRTLKIIGGLTRLYWRDGRDAFRYLPRCWQVVDRALTHHKCAEVRKFLNKHTPAKRVCMAS